MAIAGFIEVEKGGSDGSFLMLSSSLPKLRPPQSNGSIRKGSTGVFLTHGFLNKLFSLFAGEPLEIHSSRQPAWAKPPR